MKQRWIALLLALAMTLSLAACGTKEEDVNCLPEPLEEPEQPTEEETQPADGAEDPEPPAETPETPADEAAQPPADTADTAEKKPAAEAPAPVQKPAEKPASAPAAQPETPPAGASVDLAAFYEAETAGDSWPAMMQVEGETLDAFYPGLSDVKCRQCGVYTAMMSAVVGELALVEVENSADVETVRQIFQARIDQQVGDDQNPGGAWYPESIEGWKNGSRIVVNGNFVMMAALAEGVDDTVARFNQLFA